jgi:hypothetical protein
LEDIKEKLQLVNLEIYERTVLKLIFKIEGVRVLSGFISLGIWTSEETL